VAAKESRGYLKVEATARVGNGTKKGSLDLAARPSRSGGLGTFLIATSYAFARRTLASNAAGGRYGHAPYAVREHPRSKKVRTNWKRR